MFSCSFVNVGQISCTISLSGSTLHWSSSLMILAVLNVVFNSSSAGSHRWYDWQSFWLWKRCVFPYTCNQSAQASVSLSDMAGQRVKLMTGNAKLNMIMQSLPYTIKHNCASATIDKQYQIVWYSSIICISPQYYPYTNKMIAQIIVNHSWPSTGVFRIVWVTWMRASPLPIQVKKPGSHSDEPESVIIACMQISFCKLPFQWCKC